MLFPDVILQFQSTLPMRGETCGGHTGRWRCWYFNPLSPCGERLCIPAFKHWLDVFQSTLPMRGETLRRCDRKRSIYNFNPLSPCGERRTGQRKASTGLLHFNPLSPCGERRYTLAEHGYSWRISIHSPHAGRDVIYLLERGIS